MLLSSPTRELQRNHRGQTHLGQPMVTLKATSANKTTHPNNSSHVQELFALCRQVVANSYTLFMEFAAYRWAMKPQQKL